MRKYVITGLMFLAAFSATVTAKDYKGAEYRTKEAYIYGRFETRYQPMIGDGYLASFFTYHEITDSTAWNEIDFEIMGRYDHDVQITSIGPGQTIRNSHQYVAFNTHDDFHTYAFEWTPDYIAWFMDGLEVYRQTGDFISGFQYPQKIMMNIWPPDWIPWAGELDDNILPVFSFYEYVSYAAYTPGNGNTGTDNNFTLQWKDEFDYWDQDRWEKATHTWGGNNSDFVTENAVIQDGMLILCLTKTSPLGYVDNSPPALLWARGDQNEILIRFTEAVDSITAESSGNYIINGVEIVQAKRLQDPYTVQLKVNGMDQQGSYNLIVRNIEDLANPANKMSYDVVPISMAQPLTFPVKINVGGISAHGFLADQLWSPAVEYGHIDGYIEIWPESISIANTIDDVIYRSGLHELVYYKLRVPNGHYQVTIMLCENDTTVLSRPRVSDIIVEDTRVASQLNLYQQVGFHTAYDIVVNDVEVTDGILDLHFTNLWNFSLLNGLIVEQLSTDMSSNSNQIPKKYFLGQNYPNPFNPSTTILYRLPQSSFVTLKVYDLLGKEVMTLINENKGRGSYALEFDASDLSSGIYFYKMEADGFVDIKKLCLMK